MSLGRIFGLAVLCPLLVPAQDLRPAQKPKTPAESERERIEREIQGLWEITACENPTIDPLLRASGYMLVHDGSISINVVVVTRDPITKDDVYVFQGSTKKYTVTELNRLRLVSLWGFTSGDFGDLNRDVTGNTEERVIRFFGAPEIGQRLRIQRGNRDALEFARRSAVIAAPVPLPDDR